MKQKKSQYIKMLPFGVFTLIMGVFLLRYPAVVSEGIRSGLTVSGGILIPSLFPFMVLAIFIARTPLCDMCAKVFSPLTTYFFRLPKEASAAILMSFIGGFPVGAKMGNELLESGKITRKQAARMNLFCINAGPGFIISTVGANMLSSKKAGLILFISLTVSSLLIGFFSGLVFENLKDIKKENKYPQSNCDTPVSIAFVSSARDASLTLLNVCSWTILFSGLISIVSFLSLSENASFILKAFLEVTNGCMAASESYPLPVVAAVIGFSGLCVHFQIFPFMRESKIKLSHFFASRLLSCALSAGICRMILVFVPCEVSVFLNSAESVVMPFQVSLPSCIAFVLMSVLLIFDIAPRKKVC